MGYRGGMVGDRLSVADSVGRVQPVGIALLCFE